MNAKVLNKMPLAKRWYDFCAPWLDRLMKYARQSQDITLDEYKELQTMHKAFVDKHKTQERKI
jgi:hypothetical protein